MRRFLILWIMLFMPFGIAQAAVQNIDPGAVVNINQADPETISSYLKGIGPVKAQAIVAHREQYGPFKSIAELTDVKGIGEKTVERLKPYIRLE